MKNKNNNSRKTFPTLRSIRRSQVLSTYGVGSIYQFKNKYNSKSESESLMLLGIEDWFPNPENILHEWKIFEPRLQHFLKKDFFVLPPDYRKTDEDSKLRKQSLPYIRFPQWHRCTSCGLMQKKGRHVDTESLVCNAKELYEEINEKDHKERFKKIFGKCLKKKEPRQLIPVRFLVACENGHIDDFPFIKWTHKKIKDFENKHHILKAFGGRGGNSSILGLKFKCITCDTDQVDISAFFIKNLNFETNTDNLGPGFREINQSCAGFRPWLNDYENNCKAPQKVLLRGASNIYYPVTKSSIFIPVVTDQFDKEILDKINNETFWDSVKDKSDKSLDDILKSVVAGTNLEFEKLKRAIKKKNEGLLNQTQTEIDQENPQKIEEDYRFQEYDFMVNKDSSDESEMIKHEIDISEYQELKKFFSRIILVDKLRETRVQTGLSRINPFEEGSATMKQTLSIRPRKWYPGMVVHGEGIFIEFNKIEINKWVNNFNKKFIDTLNKNYNEFRKKRKLHERPINLKFLLIHTFSHILMNRLCYNCGYSSAALRERLYCNLLDKSNEMQGVLIYTSAGDSEGTLGGLVREGEPINLRKAIYESVTKAFNCSYDPICLQTKSQGLGGTNSSACHACTFVSETSCEENNQLLNRSTIIGDIQNNLSGFFEDLIE
jgi:hypothetical protein